MDDVHLEYSQIHNLIMLRTLVTPKISSVATSETVSPMPYSKLNYTGNGPTCTKAAAAYFSVTKCITHYENTPMQYTAIFHGCKNENFQLNFFDYFHILAQNIYCGYTYPQYMF